MANQYRSMALKSECRLCQSGLWFLLRNQKAVNVYDSLYDIDGLPERCFVCKKVSHDTFITNFHPLSYIRQVMEGKPVTEFQDLALDELRALVLNTCFFYNWGLIVGN